jgi:hypothetical protein
MPESPLGAYREFLKDTIRQKIDFSQTDQYQGVPQDPDAMTSHRIVEKRRY